MSSRAAPGPVVPYVGRTAETRWLRELLQQAAAGEARVALIEGESGVGKSRLLREFLREADDAGWQTLWGRYSAEPAPVQSIFLSTLAEQARRGGLLSERDYENLQASDVDPLRRAESFARLAETLAARRPLVLVLDDLQLAEANAASLFCEFARCIADAARTRPVRLLLIAALHPQLPGDPLGEALNRLRRELITTSLELHGLGEPEVSELLRHSFQGRCQPPLIDAVNRASQGNPFFVLQLANTLRDGGMLVEEAGGYRTRTPAGEMVLPVTAPEAIKSRLEQLPPGVLDVLQTASLLGDEFEFEDLIAACAPADPGPAIDTAVGLGLVEERGRAFAFHHHLVRHAFMQSLGPVERRTAHRRIAEALLARFGDAPDHIVSIALHVLDADGAGKPPLELGSLYERAGDAAMTVFARATALRLYEAALATQPYVETLTKPQLGWLQCRTARVNDNTGNRPRARDLYYQGLQNLRGSTDYEAWGLAVLGWERTFTNASERIPTDEYEYEFADASGEAGRDLRIRLLTQRADALWIAKDSDDMATAVRAADLAEESADPAVQVEALVTLGLVQMRHLEPQAALRSFDTSIRVAESLDNRIYRGWGWTRRAWPLILLGNLDEAERSSLESAAGERSHSHWAGAALGLVFQHSASLLRSSPETEAIAREALLMIARSNYLQASFILDGALSWHRLLRGEFDEAADATAMWERTAGGLAVAPMKALIEVARGRRDEVEQSLKERPWRPPNRGALDFMSIGSLCVSAELASALESEEIAERTYQLLEPLGAKGIVFGLAPPILIDRALAVSARVLGRRQLAEEHLARAGKSATQSGARTELALTVLERYRLETAVSAPTRETAASASDAWRHLRDCAFGWPVEAFGDLRAAGLAVGIPQPMPEDELSPTERDVLTAWAGGMDEGQIAARLLLSEVTVGAHLRRTRERLRIGGRADAARFGTEPPTPTPVGDLTRREREVLQLIALGKTNAQIAEELVISQHTAIRHVANILEKTGCANRTEAARLAGDY